MSKSGKKVGGVKEREEGKKEGRKERREGRGKNGRKKESRENDQVINERRDITTDQEIFKIYFSKTCDSINFNLLGNIYSNSFTNLEKMDYF